jgi:ABC-type transport system involved in multi-copper enzyme maturation permease subunit
VKWCWVALVRLWRIRQCLCTLDFEQGQIRRRRTRATRRIPACGQIFSIPYWTFMKRRLSSLALSLFAKELGELGQKRQTYVARVGFALLVFLMSGLFCLPLCRAACTAPLSVMGQGGQLLNVIYEVEWWGLCLFVPALVSPTLAAEKERHTLQLLLLTRMGPWTILLEKLLSRFVPVATILLVSLPLLLMAYLLGGLTLKDVEFAALGLAATAFQVGCIALFCSAFFGTEAMALIGSYAISAMICFFPSLVQSALVTLQTTCRDVLGHPPAFWSGIDTPQMESILRRTSAVTGIDLSLYFRSFPATVRPFHRDFGSLAAMTGIGIAFLIAARLVIVRRADLRPAHRFRRFLQLLDRGFASVNDRLALGITLGRSSGLPGNSPIAWRESRRGNLGRIHYLVRILLVCELPILLPSVTYVLTTRDLQFRGLGSSGFLLWPIALLIVSVRSAGLIAGEKSRQTLDVLLATPLSLSAVVGQKLRGLWRVMAIVSVPILIHAAFVGYFNISSDGPHGSYYGAQGFSASQSAELHFVVEVLNLIVLFSLAAQLGFLFGLKAKTQGRAVTATLAVFTAWSVIPLLIRNEGGYGDIWGEAWVMYLSPISGITLNGLSGTYWWWRLHLGTETGRFGFYLLIHLGIYAAIVACLAWFNYRLAGRVLCRPVKSTAGWVVSRVAAPSSNPSAA